jgi:hypothetical protein
MGLHRVVADNEMMVTRGMLSYVLDVLEEVGWAVYPSDVAHMFKEVVRGSRVHGIAIRRKDK